MGGQALNPLSPRCARSHSSHIEKHSMSPIYRAQREPGGLGGLPPIKTPNCLADLQDVTVAGGTPDSWAQESRRSQPRSTHHNIRAVSPSISRLLFILTAQVSIRHYTNPTSSRDTSPTTSISKPPVSPPLSRLPQLLGTNLHLRYTLPTLHTPHSTLHAPRPAGPRSTHT